MELTLQKITAMRSSKFQTILRQCPDSQCASEALVAYQEVNKEVDKFLDRMAHEVHQCVQTEKDIKPAGIIHCFSKFEYLIRHELSKIDLQ